MCACACVFVCTWQTLGTKSVHHLFPEHHGQVDGGSKMVEPGGWQWREPLGVWSKKGKEEYVHPKWSIFSLSPNVNISVFDISEIALITMFKDLAFLREDVFALLPNGFGKSEERERESVT